MRRPHKFSLLILLLTIQSCQTKLPRESQQKSSQQLLIEPEKKPAADLIKQQLYNFLKQGMQQHKLDKNQKQLKCESLKQNYHQKADWQTAWLLVFSSDAEFSCINLHEKRGILNSFANSKEVIQPLHWLTVNQNYLLSSISQLKKKNKALKRQLNNAKKLVIESNQKIEALKAIEDGINKKLNESEKNVR